MKALLITPRDKIMEIDVGLKLDDLEYAVHGTPMIARLADDYVVIVSALSSQAFYNHNEIASALAEEAIFGRAVILGVNKNTWCDISQHRKDQIFERKERICLLKRSTKNAKGLSKNSKPKRKRSRKEKSSRR